MWSEYVAAKLLNSAILDGIGIVVDLYVLY